MQERGCFRRKVDGMAEKRWHGDWHGRPRGKDSAQGFAVGREGQGRDALTKNNAGREASSYGNGRPGPSRQRRRRRKLPHRRSCGPAFVVPPGSLARPALSAATMPGKKPCDGLCANADAPRAFPLPPFQTNHAVPGRATRHGLPESHARKCRAADRRASSTQPGRRGSWTEFAGPPCGSAWPCRTAPCRLHLPAWPFLPLDSPDPHPLPLPTPAGPARPRPSGIRLKTGYCDSRNRATSAPGRASPVRLADPA